MRGQLVQAIVRGERPIWAVLALAWIVAVIVVLKRRREPVVSHLRTFGLLTLATVLSLVATTAAAALAVPRIVWRSAHDASLVADSGETWRRLRGPTALVVIGGAPDLAVPTIDAEGRWVLYAIVSGRVLDAPAAQPGTPEAGAARLCSPQEERCRPWPAEWPSPAATLGSAEFVWSKDATVGGLAYDTESGLYLRDVEIAPDAAPIELIGRIANDAPRDGTSALFVVRRIAAGMLEAVRVVAVSGEPPHYRLERARTSLVTAPAVFRWLARPLLTVGSIALPVVMLAYLLAPLWLGARLRRRSAVRRELERALVLVPIAGSSAEGSTRLATVADDTDLGDALLTRGSTVSAALAAPVGSPVASRAWFELPAPEEDRSAFRTPNGSRAVGVLVPADAAPFRRTAWALICPHAHTLAIFAIGASVAAPALVALASLAAGR